MGKSVFDPSRVDALISGAAEGAAAAWLRERTGSLDEMDLTDALSAVEAAARLGLGDRLRNARDRAGHKLVARAASSALHRLHSEGRTESATGSTWSLAPETVEVAPTAQLSYPGPDGWFRYLLLAHAAEGGAVCAWGLAHGAKGFQDDHHEHAGRGESRAFARRLKETGRHVAVPFHVAQHFVERAAEQSVRPPPEGWEHLLNHLPAGVRDAGRVLDPLQRQEHEPDRALVEEGTLVMDGAESILLDLPMEILHQCIDDVAAAAGSAIEVDPDGPERRIRESVAKAADRWMDGPNRGAAALVLEITAALAELERREPLRRVARHAGLALRAGWPAGTVGVVRTRVQLMVGALLGDLSENAPVALSEEGFARAMKALSVGVERKEESSILAL